MHKAVSKISSRRKRGFTLVELMVVISVIAILAMIGLVVFTGQEEQARKTKVQQDFEAISKQIQIARQIDGKTVFELTGVDWSNKECMTTNPAFSSCPLNTKEEDCAACVSQVETSWSKVTGKPYVQQPLPLDPWGSRYAIDENEGEPNFPWPWPSGPKFTCRWDMIRSAGRDRIAWNADDYYYFVPPYHCTTFDFPEAAVVPGTRVY